MTSRRRSANHNTSKNTTNQLVFKVARSLETQQNTEVSSGSSCATHGAAKSSSSATVGAASKRGANNRAKHRKPSRALTEKQVRLITDAATHAIRIGLPLNRMVTIDWELALVEDGLTAQASFLKSLRDWLTSRGFSCAYVWVQECGKILGLHTHILIYIPPTLVPRLGQLQRGSLKPAGVVSKAGVVCSTPIGLTSWVGLSTDPATQALYHKNLAITVRYIGKDAGTRSRKMFGITKPAHYGIVVGKRAGTSRNVGAKAILDYELT